MPAQPAGPHAYAHVLGMSGVREGTGACAGHAGGRHLRRLRAPCVECSGQLWGPGAVTSPAHIPNVLFWGDPFPRVTMFPPVVPILSCTLTLAPSTALRPQDARSERPRLTVFEGGALGGAQLGSYL